MAAFMIRFFTCNLYICCIIGLLFGIRRLFKGSLGSRLRYNLWFLLLGILLVPFLPIRPGAFPGLIAWLGRAHAAFFSPEGDAAAPAVMQKLPSGFGPINDFTLSVAGSKASCLGWTLFVLWLAGLLVMLGLMVNSALRLHTLKKSALPLQSEEARRLYKRCLKELHITANIPVYSTAFLSSPIITGFIRPRIYLPIHLIADYRERDLRYMLLHELQHYRHRDALVNTGMNLAAILYWFNPLVRLSLREMQNDREVACDSSVLDMLDEASRKEYGHTLINHAEKVSLSPFPFASGLGGNQKQIMRRIANIASYEKPSTGKKIRGTVIFTLTALLLFSLAPMVSAYAGENNRYDWNSPEENISYADLSSFFGEYEGSFVLYASTQKQWTIYNLEQALERRPPNSTYKIYDALFGLEEGIITPEHSSLAWDGQEYPIKAWNRDQTLGSALRDSVNWYFQSIDQQLGSARVQARLGSIGYGNEDMDGGLTSYWLESSLKISPVEQVELLRQFYDNDFGFSPENIQAVKEAICLSSSPSFTLYGKTGTGRVDGQDINGWFVGYAECGGDTYFFAANLQGDCDATGKRAAEICLSLLESLHIYD